MSPSTSESSFYLPQGDDVFVPTPATVGPWDARLQHGGPPAALMGRALERVAARSDVRIAHFSLDFLGVLPVAPMTVRAELARPGKRVELVTATVDISGRPALRGSAWRIAVGDDRGPRVGLDEPPPAMPEVESHELFEGVPEFGYGRAFEWRFVDGGFRSPGPATVWSRLKIPLLSGEPVTPLERVLAMVDSANGVSWELDLTTHTFVPVNLTVSMTRAPASEWVGMRAVTRLGGDGIGTTHARLFDTQGFLGEATQTLFVGKR